MKFGLFSLFDFFPERQSEIPYYRETLDLIVRADELGLDHVWIGEEHFYSFGICPRPVIYLTAIAQRTRNIRLGTAVSLLPFDNPLRTAEDFAMLDVLSDGRVDLGVGRGLIPKHFVAMRAKSVITSPSGTQQLSGPGFYEIRGLAWKWNGQETLVQSRCTDETGYVQPAREALIQKVGLHAGYHFNGIQSWRIAADGKVSHA